MRCLVRLTAAQSQAYETAYHLKLQGLLYELLETAGYEFIHREQPFKFVTFSNIFPPEDMGEGESRTWIIASPNQDVIQDVADVLADRGQITVGDQRYWIDDQSVFQVTPEESGTLITGTPIIIRIPASRCERYGIENEAGYDDVYWQLDHPQEAFQNEVERNLAAKYREYHDDTPPERPYFDEYRPRKQVAVPLHYAESVAQIIATTWELEYTCRVRDDYRLIEIALGAGVGELNTTGFGFVNKQ